MSIGWFMTRKLRTDGVNCDADVRAQDLVPLEDAKDRISIVGDGAERVLEGSILGEVSLKRFFLLST